MMLPGSVSPAESMKTSCPRCKSPAQEDCTYLNTHVNFNMGRVGKPMKTIHGERRHKRWRELQQQMKDDLLQEAKDNVPEKVRIYRAEKAFDLQEQDDLILWLRMFAHVLIVGDKK